MPVWIVKLMRRLLGLQPGRYLIVLSVMGDGWDWSISEAGKIEELSRRTE